MEKTPNTAIQAQNETSCYDITLPDSSHLPNVRGWLTYDLNPMRPRSQRRDVLLVRSNLISRASLPRRAQDQLDLLGQWYSSDMQRGAKRLAAAKMAVNRVMQSPNDYPEYSVAVYHAGPVLAVRLPKEFDVVVRCGGDEYAASIAVYRDIEDEENRLSQELGQGADDERRARWSQQILQSFGHDTARMFRRYFEDVAEDFHDIVNVLGLGGVLKRCKQAERCLGISIGSKLRFITGDYDGSQPKTKPLAPDQRLFLDQHPTEVFIAGYVRNWALYFINELYELVGICSRSNDYLRRIGGVAERFSTLIGPDRVETLMQQQVELSRLQEALDLYRRGALDELHDLVKKLPPDRLWLRHFCEFASFLLLVRQYGLPLAADEIEHADKMESRPHENITSEARIFLSRAFNTGACIEMRNRIEEYLREAKLPARLLTVEEARPDRPFFHELIRARIWLCDAVHTIIPAPGERLDHSDVSYEWIAIETEYGLLLGKPVYHFIDKAAGLKDLLPAFSSERIKWMVPQARISASARRERVKEHLAGQIHHSFTIPSESSTLGSDAQNWLSTVIKNVLKQRTNELVRGYFEQFGRLTRKSFVTLRNAARIKPWEPAASLASAFTVGLALEQSRSARDKRGTAQFRTMWNQELQSRALMVQGRPETLLRVGPKSRALRERPESKRRKNHRLPLRVDTYVWNLTDILRGLRPSASEEDIEVWECQLLDIDPSNDPWVNHARAEAEKKRAEMRESEPVKNVLTKAALRNIVAEGHEHAKKDVTIADSPDQITERKRTGQPGSASS